MNDKQNSKVKDPVIDISLDVLLPNAGGSIFRLARMAMIRAVEIHCGSPALIKRRPLDKDTTVALREISVGKVVIKEKGMKLEKGRHILTDDVQIDPVITEDPIENLAGA